MKPKSEYSRAFLRTFLYSVWVPLSIVVLYLIQFGLKGFDLQSTASFLPRDTHTYLATLVSWPCGMPLTYAFQKLFRNNRKTAFFTVVVFAPLCAMAATVGGLLGAVGVALYTLIVSLPVWLIYFIAKGISQWRQR
ncbi:MAG: hypothetical protein OXI60_08845 [Acidiferrobacterales bacterium]|nr:hypothetical protein [Acidiferrobacterales bacterium]